MRAQKRISAPNSFGVERKISKWVARAKPGPHDKNALPLVILLRDVIGLARNAKEVKRLLYDGKVLVDGVLRKDYRFPVGFMDLVSTPLSKGFYRVSFSNTGKLIAFLVKKSEAGLKLVRVKGKKRRKSDYQLSTNDGRSIIVKLSVGKSIRLGDSLLIKVPSQEVVKHFSFKVGASVFIVGGKQVGQVGVIKSLEDDIVVLDLGGEEHRTISDYVFIVGDKKPELMVNE